MPPLLIVAGIIACGSALGLLGQKKDKKKTGTSQPVDNSMKKIAILSLIVSIIAVIVEIIQLFKS